jgi:parvulin-like peptidyl-prolyl isomerase
MKKSAAILLLALAACEPTAPPAPPPAPPKAEPERITVRHILVAFQGAPRVKATRSRDEAKALAEQLLERVKKGEDFAALMKQHSDDTGPGVYSLVNHGVAAAAGTYPRKGMVAAFGDVGFTLEVNGIGLAPHDPAKSPFGWHIIQRTQ